MRCKVENAGYPGLANNTNTGLLSYNITLTDPRLLAELTITKESIGKDEDDEESAIIFEMTELDGDELTLQEIEDDLVWEEVVDKIAAVLILQLHLDKTR